MRDIAYMFKQAVVRRVVYVLVALVFGWLSMGHARAQAVDYTQCHNTGVNGGQCEDREVATNMVAARATQYCSTNFPAGGSFTCTPDPVTYQFPAVSVGYAVSVPHYCEVARPERCNEAETQIKQWNRTNGDCEAPKVWDDASHTCKGPRNCAAEPMPDQNGWVSGPTAALGTICINGCGFARSTGALAICTSVDSTEYCRVAGMLRSSETTCAADGSSDAPFGNPPADSDGDGKSDANDPKPNHPGENGDNGPNAPDGQTKDDGKGSGNGNRSSGGGGCGAGPSSAGDEILGMVAYQTWATRCAVDALNKALTGGTSGIGTGGAGGAGGAGGGGTGGAGPEKTRDLLEGIKTNTKKGEASGGGCTPEGAVSGFACSGDPVGCIQAEKLAVANCREQAKDSDNNGVPDWMQGDEPDIEGDGDNEYDEPEFGVNVGTSGLDKENIFGSGSCPTFSMNIMGHIASTADIPGWCDIASIMRAVILLMAAYLALQILMGKFG